MSDLLAARSQMALSLAFHIVFAVVGLAMPLLMLIAEGLWLRTRERVYLELAHRWAKGTAILFAVGAVSGTVLSFELGLLWPEFMRYAGPIIGMPFSMEGFAFFVEGIFLGIYLYGWERVPERAHWLSGAVVLVSATLSGVFVVTVNAWMNTPVGFDLVDGRPANIRPVEAMLNPAAPTQVLHMAVAAFIAIGFAVAAIHAYMLLRDPQNRFHRAAFAIALAVGGSTALLGPITGDLSAKMVAAQQPAKFAAMEGHFESERGAALIIGGFPDEEAAETRYAIRLPGLLSFLAFGDADAEVQGLADFPRGEWPPVAITHFGFQIMVACGTAMVVVGLLGAWLAWRRRGLPLQRWYLWLVVASGPLGFIAIEAGWTVTEVGRQPWIVHGLMRTAEAVTPMPMLIVPFTVFSLVYLLLAVLVAMLMRRQVFASPRYESGGSAYPSSRSR